MITRLEVDGFKSLRSFGIDLAPFTALIGPNSAGKSNVLEAIALLSHLASEPVEAAFKHGRGRAIDQVTLEKGEPVRSIRFAVELLSPVEVAAGEAETTNRLRYELTIARERRASGAEALLIEHERLSSIAAEKDAWIAANPELSASARHASEEMDLLRQVGSATEIRRGDRRVRVSRNDHPLRVVSAASTGLAALTPWVGIADGPRDSSISCGKLRAGGMADRAMSRTTGKNKNKKRTVSRLAGFLR